MKRNFLAAAVILSTLLGLTACGSESISTSTDNTSSLPTQSGDNITSEPALTDPVSSNVPDEPASSDTQSEVVQVENWEDFIGADGQPVTLADATLDDMGNPTFDYAFLGYVPPIYDDTFQNPELINWETMEFAANEGYTPTGIRVRTGDVLENGLTVTQAVHTLEYDTMIDEATQQPRNKWVSSSGFLMLDGEITLNGTMYCVPADDYMAFEGELHFFPDTNSFPQFPVVCDFAPKERKPSEIVYPDAKFAVRCGAVYYMGNISDVDCSGVIEKGEAAPVTVTLNNIRLITANPNHGGRGNAYYADIVSIDRLDS